MSGSLVDAVVDRVRTMAGETIITGSNVSTKKGDIFAGPPDTRRPSANGGKGASTAPARAK